MITFREVLAETWFIVWTQGIVRLVGLFWRLVMWFKRKIEMW